MEAKKMRIQILGYYENSIFGIPEGFGKSKPYYVELNMSESGPVVAKLISVLPNWLHKIKKISGLTFPYHSIEKGRIKLILPVEGFKTELFSYTPLKSMIFKDKFEIKLKSKQEILRMI